MDERQIERPNIVLIMTDSQGLQMVGYEGHGIVETPHLDRLAAQSVRFNRAYNSCPLCTPARAALFSGQVPQVAGPWANDLPLGSGVSHMGDYFAGAGYDTAYVGKWHLDGTDYFGSGVPASGWNADAWFDGRNYLSTLTPEERQRWRNGLPDAASIHRHGVTREWTWAGGITDRAIDFLSRDHHKPFLLVASYDEPHGPSVCPPPFCDMYTDQPYRLPPSYADSLENKPEHHRLWAQRQNLDPTTTTRSQPLYLGATSFVDDEIGRILAEVDRRHAADTIVVFTSDHGHYMGAHRLDGKGPALYEEVVRIPLLMRVPVDGLAGSSVREPVSHLDVLPTLMSLSGIAVPPALHGAAIFHRAPPDPAAARRRGRRCHSSEEPPPHDPVFPTVERAPVRTSAFSGFDRFSISHDSWFGLIPIRAVVTERYKLVVNLHQSDELYDLSDDPHEMTNRIDDASLYSVREELFDEILTEMDRVRDPFRGPEWLSRSWRSVSAPGWTEGERRPRPDDALREASLHYDTGLPAMNDDPITIDADFPGGNILVHATRGSHAVVQQEIGESMEWWFYWAFRAGNLSGRELLVSFTNGEVVGPHGPAVSLDGVHWQWGLGVTDYTPDSFSCRFSDEVSTVYFAFAPPYQLRDFMSFVSRHRRHPALRLCTLGRTAGNRDVPLLRLGNPRASRDILLTARHHACEAPASYELEGLCDYLLTSESRLLESHQIHVVPFEDLDGVEDGDQGKFRFPYDHNRAYRKDTRYPEIAALVEYRDALAIELYLDLHAPFKWGGRHDHSHFVLRGEPWDSSSRRISDLLAEETRAAQCGVVHDPEWDLPFGQEWNTGEFSHVSSTGSLQSQMLRTAVTIELPYFGPDADHAVGQESARCFGKSLAIAMERFFQ